MKNKHKIILISFALIIGITLLILTCIKLIPFITSLSQEENRLHFQQFISDFGIKGILIMVFLQILQVFIAFIPGEIIELLAGFIYGTWGGLIICLIGNAIGSFLIYATVKFFANKYTIKLQDKFKTYSFLNNKKKVALYLFVIYLIPGLPKDIITYLIPFLPITFHIFIITTSIARIPSIISSTYSSKSILDNNYTIAIILFVIFSILAIIGFIFKNNIITLFKNSNNDKSRKE